MAAGEFPSFASVRPGISSLSSACQTEPVAVRHIDTVSAASRLDRAHGRGPCGPRWLQGDPQAGVWLPGPCSFVPGRGPRVEVTASGDRGHHDR